MFSIELNKNTINIIDNFIDSYLNSFLNLFIDSGIDNINEIEENYINIAINFRDKIYFSITSILSKDVIIGKRIGINNKLNIIISIGNFKLFIDYTESIIDKTRFIDNINIYKK